MPPTTTTTPQAARSLYRRLLRELPTSSTPAARLARPSPASAPTSTSSTPSKSYRSSAYQKLSAPSLLQQRLRTTFSTPSTEGSQKAQLEMAEQAVQYVQAQRMYATLIERYNPGMGMSEEERVRLTARKVGMDLPPEFSG